MGSHKLHADLCEAIRSLEKVNNEKLRKTENFVADSEKLPYSLRRNLIISGGRGSPMGGNLFDWSTY